MLSTTEVQWLSVSAQVLQAVFFFIGLYFFFQWIPPRRRRIPLRIEGSEESVREPPRILQRILLIRLSEDTYEETKQLLLAAGLRIPVLWYETYSRGILACSVFVFLAGIFDRSSPAQVPGIPYRYLLISGAAGIAVFFFRRSLLEAFKKRRSYRMVEEIFVLSNQLLYFSGSRANLHQKLLKCLPHTKLIRADLHLLLHEWYGNPERAIANFKNRLGTDEGRSFADTLDSLRQYEHEAYYRLLKQRIQDYKDKLDMIRDSRKEGASYMLFVLAGIPILNTFRIFIYPWVEEGRKLFETLN